MKRVEGSCGKEAETTVWCAVLCCCLACVSPHLVCCVLKAHPVADQAPQRHTHLVSNPLSDRHSRNAPQLRAHHLQETSEAQALCVFVL